MIKDCDSGINAIKSKHGLEEAINALMKDPKEGVPEEMRYVNKLKK